MPNTPVGKITHYFDKIGVAVLLMDSGTIDIGDTIQIGEGDTAFSQSVDSMQVDHKPVTQAVAGNEVGLKVTQPVTENAPVFKKVE